MEQVKNNSEICKMQQLKVAIFDDNKTRLFGLQLLIDSVKEMKCVGVYEDCRNLVDNLNLSTPDVVLMDIDMPHVNGIAGVKLIKENFPEIKILMQTVFEDDEKIFASICAGADGYILKKTAPQKLIENITEVNEGGAPMTPSIARQVLYLFSNQHRSPTKLKIELSHREQEILSLLVQGLSYKMIAEHCGISYTTVNTHIKHIYKKLQVNSVVEAVKMAIDQRIV